MNSLLNELVNPNTAVLTDTQKAVLCLITVSNSPKMAFDGISASKNLAYAGEDLRKLGIVTITNNTVSITPLGTELLQQHNLVDGGDMLTQDGKDVLAASQEVGNIFNVQSIQEDFNFLKSLG
jgi:hypothetical protein